METNEQKLPTQSLTGLTFLTEVPNPGYFTSEDTNLVLKLNKMEGIILQAGAIRCIVKNNEDVLTPNTQILFEGLLSNLMTWAGRFEDSEHPFYKRFTKNVYGAFQVLTTFIGRPSEFADQTDDLEDAAGINELLGMLTEELGKLKPIVPSDVPLQEGLS